MRLSSLLRRFAGGAQAPAAVSSSARATQDAPLSLVLVTRADCGLCDEMKAGLRGLRGARPFRLREVDVLSDPELVLRYALRIPVLLAGERVLCEGRATARELECALAGAAPEAATDPVEAEGS